jgi:hypothetical protein
MVADLWVEFRWFFLIPAFLIGRSYGWVWRQAQIHGGPWVAQYIVLAALSVYLVMQTMEAVIFRFLLMSLPLWITWKVAQGSTKRHWRASVPATQWTPALADEAMQ